MRKDAKELILERMKKSTLPKQKCYHDKFFLNHIQYGDVMDIVLYYISLQRDVTRIAKIPCNEFSRILEKITKGWMGGVEKQWGTVKTPRNYGSKEIYDRPRIWAISSAWTPGPGPMGGTMSVARYYEVLYPGFSQHDYLLAFFRYPKGLPLKHGNWPYYKKQVVEAATFPKWRRKMHRKRLETVFELAELACRELRKESEK